MGLVIKLQSESGTSLEEISDDRNILHRVLPQDGDSILSGIDWYADTTFNGQQMRQVVPALQELIDRESDPEAKELLSAILKMAERCADWVHLYLIFVGD
jgi:hypothetical protein